MYFKDITIESAGADLQISETRKIDMQNVRINGKLVSVADQPDQR